VQTSAGEPENGATGKNIVSLLVRELR
jgi:hypothetical protein